MPENRTVKRALGLEVGAKTAKLNLVGCSWIFDLEFSRIAVLVGKNKLDQSKELPSTRQALLATIQAIIFPRAAHAAEHAPLAHQGK